LAAPDLFPISFTIFHSYSQVFELNFFSAANEEGSGIPHIDGGFLQQKQNDKVHALQVSQSQDCI